MFTTDAWPTVLEGQRRMPLQRLPVMLKLEGECVCALLMSV
jgi:hypothetical protein